VSNNIKGEIGGSSPSTWIKDGEKYGLVGLDVKVDEHIPSGSIAPNLSILADTTFNVPSNWREWLGSIRAREVEDCNLFLLSTQPSQTPDILDVENEQLKQYVWNFYVGLLLASTFAPAHRPVILTGSRRQGEIDIRQAGFGFSNSLPFPALSSCCAQRYPASRTSRDEP
jgi:hypothetical protein